MKEEQLVMSAYELFEKIIKEKDSYRIALYEIGEKVHKFLIIYQGENKK